MRIQFKFTESFNPPFNASTFDKEKVAAAITDSVEAANERVLAYVVDANRRLADFAVTSADRVAEALPVAVPFADKLPTATESADRYVDFVERAVAMNREFNQRVLAKLTVDAPAVVEEVAENVTETVTAATVLAEKVPAKKVPAKKTPAKKAPAKKASVKKATAKKAPAKKAAAKKAPAQQAAATTSTSSS
jgi:hypothetical protein